MSKEKFWLILPDTDGSRKDTKIASEYSSKEIADYLAQGYIKVCYEDFNKLLNNRDGEYCISADGTIYPKPPYVPTLDELKTTKENEIKQSYIKDVNAIVWVTQSDGSVLGYDTDKDSQIDFNSSYQRAQLNGTTRYNVYVDKNDLSQKVFTVHTPEMFEAALEAAGNYQEDVYAHYYETKLLIENAENEEALKAISW